jgi:hypothetical protein
MFAYLANHSQTSYEHFAAYETITNVISCKHESVSILPELAKVHLQISGLTSADHPIVIPPIQP